MHSPRFSIIVISYNQQQYVREAVESILRSSLAGIEVICIDDGSIDATADILRLVALTDPRVRVLQLEHSGRPAVARNAGLKVARGEYVCFLDGDDLVHGERFALLDEAITGAGEVDVLFHDYADFPDGTAPGAGTRCLASTPVGGALRALCDAPVMLEGGVRAHEISSTALAEFLLARSFVVNTGTICVRHHHLLQRQATFPVDRVVGEDTVVWMRCILNARVVLVDACLFYWRKYPRSLTGSRTVAKQRELVRSMHELSALVEPELPVSSRIRIRERIFDEEVEVGMLLELQGRRLAAVGSYAAAALRFRRPRALIRAAKALVRRPRQLTRAS